MAWYGRLATFSVINPRAMLGGGYLGLPVEVRYQQVSATVAGLVEHAEGGIAVDTPPSVLVAGEAIDLPVRLKNRSIQAWIDSECHPINLSYQWLDESGLCVVADGERTRLPVRLVVPEQEVTMTMRVVAPEPPGRYTLRLLPVLEYRYWFDAKGFSPKHLSLIVDEPPVRVEDETAAGQDED